MSLDCEICKENLKGEDTINSHMKGTHNKRAEKQPTGPKKINKGTDSCKEGNMFENQEVP